MKPTNGAIGARKEARVGFALTDNGSYVSYDPSNPQAMRIQSGKPCLSEETAMRVHHRRHRPRLLQRTASQFLVPSTKMLAWMAFLIGLIKIGARNTGKIVKLREYWATIILMSFFQ